MIRKQFASFWLRWFASSFGMWLCITTFGKHQSEYGAWLFVIAGLVFSLVNAIIKPLVTIFALPLIILTVGLFTLVVNAAMFALTIWILPGITMNLGGVVISTIIMTLVNSLANYLMPDYNRD